MRSMIRDLGVSLLFGIFVAFLLATVAQDSAPAQDLTQVEEVSACDLCGYDFARVVLRDDFIAPEDVMATRDMPYSDEQLAVFEATLPPPEIIAWLYHNRYILVAGPPRALSLLDVRSNDENLFFTSSDGWYADADEQFSRDDIVGPVWLAIRKSSVPNSTDRTWSEQLALLSANERVPNAAEIAWALTTYNKVHGVNLMVKVHVRTLSVVSGGSHVGIINFDSGDLSIMDFGDDYRDDRIGISSALIFLTES